MGWVRLFWSTQGESRLLCEPVTGVERPKRINQATFSDASRGSSTINFWDLPPLLLPALARAAGAPALVTEDREGSERNRQLDQGRADG